ncbi:helix-turn-helix transcriptional regulator [Haloterrigena alkaliphila]|uniref:DUF7343 domain-containing protein n=1 Tax=Haloterrigena alkaliphila TaxID=2816475 RepID=A0A8A2VHJ6_9EURY|nr:hypothetical protein [Haloterrigena alkaliphila]QSW99834.1 hypothetical protein J0X25_02400 [Haloterrigena alkaliphila]
MSRRSSPPSRVVRRVRRTVRAGLRTISSLVRVSPRSDTPDGGHRTDDGPHRDRQHERGGSDHGGRTERRRRTDRGRDTATRLESRADSNADPLDPDTGPTSRGEILEYGWLPSEYVRAVLADHGGRIKQRRFVDEYGWSPSTLSELLSSLEDDGAIERYRLGREKVVRLPEEERRMAPMAGRGRENGTR